jgi:AraC-like DNA-binding protein
MRMPFYGLVILATGKQPIEVRHGDYNAQHFAMAVWGKDMHFKSDTGYLCISANPLHRDFRAYAALPEPYVVALSRNTFEGFDPQIARAIEGSLNHADATALFDGVLALARPSLPPPPPLDDRAQSLMRQLWIDPKCSITKLAEHLGLSYHRTSHLFSEAVGLPVRKYQLWQKLYRAAGPLSAGASLTEAAHAAGFVDSAHFSRTFQTAYGRSPRELFRTRRIRVFAPETFNELALPEQTTAPPGAVRARRR